MTNEEKFLYLELIIQRNLSSLLKTADISVENFAESLGVTDQTIRNLMSYETFISRMQFLSIMILFEQERKEEQNDSLDLFLNILLDPKKYKKFMGVSKSIISNEKNNKKPKAPSIITAGVIATMATVCLPGSAILGPVIGKLVGTLAATSTIFLTTHSASQELLKELKETDNINSALDWKSIFHNVKYTLTKKEKKKEKKEEEKKTQDIFIKQLKDLVKQEKTKKEDLIPQKENLFDETIARLLEDC